MTTRTDIFMNCTHVRAFINGGPGLRHENRAEVMCRRWSLVLGGLLLSVLLTIGHAQDTAITPDTSLGMDAATVVADPVMEQLGSRYDITGGDRRGTNLFHSFDEFSVGTDDIANFQNDTGMATTNILSRVTRADPANTSKIYGTIRTTDFESANLFLLNPNGIIFGPGAQLDINGSFHATTADYIRLADDGRFGTDISDPANTMLTMAPPAAFGFLGNGSGQVIFEPQSEFAVPDGEILSIVGGDVVIKGGSLTAPSGRIDIVSSASAGEADIDGDGNYVDDNFDQLGDVSISQNGTLDAGTFSEEPGGFITIKSGQLSISGGAGIDASSGVVGEPTAANGDAGDISITVTNLSLTGGGSIESAAFGQTGNAGTIDINADSISITGASSGLYTDTFGSGLGGLIDLNANRITVDAGGIIDASSGSSDASMASNGHAGDIHIAVTELSLTNGGLIQSAAFGQTGNAGSIEIQAESISITGENPDTELASGLYTDTFGSGLGGLIDLRGLNDPKADRIILAAGGTIDASTDFAPSEGGSTSPTAGQGGDILVSTSVLESNDGKIEVSTFGAGQAGFLTINADQVQLTGDAEISTDVEDGATGGGGILTINARTIALESLNGEAPEISSDTEGNGEAGNVTLIASESIQLLNSTTEGDEPGILANSKGKGTGNAGDIFIKAPEITISGGTIDTSTISGATGDTGLITVEANNLSLTDDGNIQSINRGSGAGGLVSITASETVRMSGEAEISTDVEDGATGAGGSLLINSPTITLEHLNGEAPEISSDTEGEGDAGDVTLIATDTIRLLNSKSEKEKPGVFANSKGKDAGNAGDIFVTTPILELVGSEIKTSSEDSAGGIINIESQDLVYLLDSEISAEAKGVTATDDGGNVIIDPTFVVLNNSKIIADANQGFGGVIDITTTYFLKDNSSTVTASSAAGPQFDGIVIIDTPNEDVTASVTILDVAFLDVSGLLRERCSAAAERERSSFTVAGKGGVPRAPNTYFPSMPHDIHPHAQTSRIGEEHGETFIRVAGRQSIPWAWTEKLGCI